MRGGSCRDDAPCCRKRKSDGAVEKHPHHFPIVLNQIVTTLRCVYVACYVARYVASGESTNRPPRLPAGRIREAPDNTHLAASALRAAEPLRQPRNREIAPSRGNERRQIERHAIAALAAALEPLGVRPERARHPNGRTMRPGITEGFDLHKNELGTNALHSQADRALR